MKLEKLKSCDEWLIAENKEKTNETINEYIQVYKRGFEKDNRMLILKNDDTRYILPINLEKDIDNILAENKIKKEDVVKISKSFTNI